MAGRTHCISNEDTLPRRLAAASLITLLLLIFIVDLMVPWGYAVPILYLLPLILTLWLPSAVTPFALAVLCTAFLMVGSLHSPPGGDLASGLFNRASGVLTIWGSWLLLHRYRQAMDQLTAEQQGYRTREAEEALRESEQRLAAILESALDAVIGMDAQGRITSWNQRAEVIFGWARSEAIGQVLAQLIVPAALREAHESGLHCRVQEGEGRILNRRVETTAMRRDGTTFSVELSVTQLMVGQAPQFCAFINEITERKRAEKALRDSEALLQNVLNTLPVGVWILDATGRIIRGNPASYDIWRGARYVGIEDFGQYKAWWSHTGQRVEAEAWGGARAIRKGQTSLNEEVRIECFDGTTKTVLNSAMPIRDADLQIAGAIIVNQDITDWKQAEDALRESEGRFRTLCEAVPQQVWTATPDGALDYVNQRALDEFGLPGEQVLGWAWMQVVHPDDLAECRRRWRKALETGEPYEVEFRLKRESDHAYRWHIGRAVPLHDKEGHIVKWYGANTDISETKSAADRLRESERLARATVDALSANVAILDEAGTILAVNRAWRTCAGRKGSGMPHLCEGGNYLTACDDAGDGKDDDARIIAQGIRDVIRQAVEEFVHEYRCRETIDERWFVLRVTRFSGEGPVRVVVAHEHVTQRKQTEISLKLAHDQLRDLAAKLVEAEEEERACLARELHDEFAQILTGMTFNIVRIGKQLREEMPPSKLAKLQQDVGAMEQLVNKMTVATRRIATGLRPSVLDQLGLIAALRWLGAELESSTGLSCRMAISPECEQARIGPVQSTTVFRITQELLTNIARHAGASRVTFEFMIDGDLLTFAVHDDGRGITEEEVGHSASLGLRGIQERIALLGGRFEIYGLPGEGTSVQVRIPNSCHSS